jgi:hypothetical protein
MSIEPLTDRELLEHRLESALEDLRNCEAAALFQTFRAGDHILHAPSGEMLACDQRGNDVLPAGWPETTAKATHCRLVKAASDEERGSMLRQVAAARPDNGGDSSRRQRLAAAQLTASEAT